MLDEDAIEQAFYNAMRRREREISECNAAQAEFFREQEELKQKQQADHFAEQGLKKPEETPWKSSLTPRDEWVGLLCCIVPILVVASIILGIFLLVCIFLS